MASFALFPSLLVSLPFSVYHPLAPLFLLLLLAPLFLFLFPLLLLLLLSILVLSCLIPSFFFAGSFAFSSFFTTVPFFLLPPLHLFRGVVCSKSRLSLGYA